MYYIIDTRSYCGNSVFFWCDGGNGYTTDPNKAWKVEHFNGRETDKLVPVEVIDKVKKYHVDMQDLKGYL